MTPYDLFFVTSALILGLIVGSFLNVVIYRYPVYLFKDWIEQAWEILIEGKEVEASQRKSKPSNETFNIAYPASHCPKCKAPIKPWHNIPVISYFFLLKGKCHACEAPISIRYPILELVTGLLTAFVVWMMGITPEAGFIIVFTWCLIVLTMIDIDHQLLPDDIVYCLLWLGLLLNTQTTFARLEDAVIGCACGYLSLWSFNKLFKLIRKKEGMGYGDFKLFAAFGAWMGWQSLPLIIILSSLVGAVIGITLMLVQNKDSDFRIPFGPYLAMAAWIAFFWGDWILHQYLVFSGIR